MKRLITYILLLQCLITASCKKDKLQWEKTIEVNVHTQSNFNRILVTKNNTIIVVGGERFDKAEIVISRDGGNNWEVKSFPEVGKGLYALSSSPDGTIYTVGFDSKLLFSKDDGYNWHYKLLNNWKNCVGIAFPDNSKGYIITTEAQREGLIFTINANQDIDTSVTYTFGFSDIYMSGNVGYVAGYGAVLKTLDGGVTWHYMNIKNDDFSAIYAINQNDIWICGAAGSIFHTTNGGNDWQKLRNGNDLTKPKYNLRDILFINKNEGWAVGDDGIVIYTDDAGEHWMEYEHFTDNGLKSIALMPDGNLLACGEKGSLYKLVR